MPDLLLATRNAHKTHEIATMLAGHFRVSDLTAHPAAPEVEETGTTFVANATLKATAISEFFDGWALADDSGIEVDALGGAPGVWSARYAGVGTTDAANNALLLKNLAGVRGKARSGRFRCVLALAHRGNLIATFDGAVEGIIVNELHGTGGFGYDPLFLPEGHCETFGTLPPEVKNSISHRSRALAKFVAWLRERPEIFPS